MENSSLQRTRIKAVKLLGSPFQSGVRFKPTRQELLLYLYRKVAGLPYPDDVITDCDEVYGDETNRNNEPWNLFDFRDNKEGEIFYVFTCLKKVKGHRDTSTRIQRLAGSGTWSGRTTASFVKDFNGRIMGFDKYYSFEVKGGDEASQRLSREYGRWTMHELSLPDKQPSPGDIVLCVIGRNTMISISDDPESSIVDEKHFSKKSSYCPLIKNQCNANPTNCGSCFSLETLKKSEKKRMQHSEEYEHNSRKRTCNYSNSFSSLDAQSGSANGVEAVVQQPGSGSIMVEGQQPLQPQPCFSGYENAFYSTTGNGGGSGSVTVEFQQPMQPPQPCFSGYENAFYSTTGNGEASGSEMVDVQQPMQPQPCFSGTENVFYFTTDNGGGSVTVEVQQPMQPPQPCFSGYENAFYSTNGNGEASGSEMVDVQQPMQPQPCFSGTENAIYFTTDNGGGSSSVTVEVQQPMQPPQPCFSGYKNAFYSSTGNGGCSGSITVEVQQPLQPLPCFSGYENAFISTTANGEVSGSEMVDVQQPMQPQPSFSGPENAFYFTTDNGGGIGSITVAVQQAMQPPQPCFSGYENALYSTPDNREGSGSVTMEVQQPLAIPYPTGQDSEIVTMEDPNFLQISQETGLIETESSIFELSSHSSNRNCLQDPNLEQLSHIIDGIGSSNATAAVPVNSTVLPISMSAAAKEVQQQEDHAAKEGHIQFNEAMNDVKKLETEDWEEFLNNMINDI